jgi:hypothetical protein
MLAPISGQYLDFKETLDCLVLPTTILLLSTIEDGPLVAMSFVVNIPHIGWWLGVVSFARIVPSVGGKVTKLEGLVRMGLLFIPPISSNFPPCLQSKGGQSLHRRSKHRAGRAYLRGHTSKLG